MATPPKRTDYTTLNTFNTSTSDDPSTHITFHFNTDPSRPEMTKMILPENSTWTPSPHWHEHYSELIEVKQGRVLFIISGKETIATPADGPQRIPKFAIHNWMRADAHLPADQKDKGEVVVEEWTDPGDKMHQIFFRNLLGLKFDEKGYWGRYAPLQAMLILYTFDNWPVLMPSFPKLVNYAAAHAQLGVVAHAARVLGLKAWCEEYTPDDMRELAAKGIVQTWV